MAGNLKNKRLFYESWQMLDVNWSVMTDQSQTPEAQENGISPVRTDEMPTNPTIKHACEFNNSRNSQKLQGQDCTFWQNLLF